MYTTTYHVFFLKHSGISTTHILINNTRIAFLEVRTGKYYQ